MLNMTRRVGERAIVTCPDGAQIEILITESRNGRAKIGIEAPKNYLIDREETVIRREQEELERDDSIGNR